MSITNLLSNYIEEAGDQVTRIDLAGIKVPSSACSPWPGAFFTPLFAPRFRGNIYLGVKPSPAAFRFPNDDTGAKAPVSLDHKP